MNVLYSGVRKRKCYIIRMKNKNWKKLYRYLKEYIADNPFADLIWSEKLGYVYLCISFPQREIEMTIVIDRAETLCDRVFYEIGQDVLDEAGNDHAWENANIKEKAEIWKRLNEYLELIPQYRYIAEKIYPKDK